MSESRELAVIAAHLRPAQGFGGVAESTAELVLGWLQLNRNLRIAVSDASMTGRVSISDFAQLYGEKLHVYRALPQSRSALGLGAIFAVWAAIRRSDGVYISGIATWPTTLAALYCILLKKPYVAAVRGGLMPEHWDHIRSARPLKAAFYRLAVFPTLKRARRVHVASDLEARGVLSALPGTAVVVAPNVFSVGQIECLSPAREAKGGFTLLYLGRLSNEKGILGFSRKFAEVCGPTDRLVVVGPSIGEYGALVLEFCASTSKVDYRGIVAREGLQDLFNGVDALILPSGVDGHVRENFGNVVVESLLHGRPVLVASGLAWAELETHGVGVEFHRSLSDLQDALERLRNQLDGNGLANRCRNYAESKFSVPVVAARLWRAVFEE